MKDNKKVEWSEWKKTKIEMGWVGCNTAMEINFLITHWRLFPFPPWPKYLRSTNKDWGMVKYYISKSSIFFGKLQNIVKLNWYICILLEDLVIPTLKIVFRCIYCFFSFSDKHECSWGFNLSSKNSTHAQLHQGT